MVDDFPKIIGEEVLFYQLIFGEYIYLLFSLENHQVNELAKRSIESCRKYIIF